MFEGVADVMNESAHSAGPVARFRLPAWATDVFTGVILLLAAFAPNPDDVVGVVRNLGLTVVLLLAVALILPLRRRFPLSILGGSIAVAVLAPLWAASTLGFLLAAAIAVHRVALVTNRRTTVITAAIAIAILVGGTALTGTVGWQYARLVQPVALLAVAAAIGDATRNRRAYIDAITERAIRAERTRELEAERRVTEERLRIARELHDAAAHQIAAINLHAGVASNALPDRPEDAERALEVIRASARSVLSEISALLRVLRSTPSSPRAQVAEPVVNLAALDDLVEEFERSGLRVTKRIAGDLAQVQGAVSITAYKVIQEGMANALKHGADATAQVDMVIADEQVTVQIMNRVRPLANTVHADSGQHGLIGMRERVESVHGSMSTDDAGGRFILTATLPVGTTSTRRSEAGRAADGR
ncbi:MAG TPA: histidine kinase [Microbacteriaceae bacterium]|nr:histidine kinase [Microbacteriaceae bacterium]